MFKIQWKQTDVNLLCNIKYLIVVFLIVLASFNVTWAVFNAPAAWESFDPSANGVGTDPKGNINGAFDGRYIYFAPLANNTEHHAEVLRYDTLCESNEPFIDPNCWTTFDYGKAIGDSNIAGYLDVLYDGSRYLYYNPWVNNSGYHGNVLRYDTQGEFNDTDAWLHFDLQTKDSNCSGFGGLAFDGKHIYMPTFSRESLKSRIVRYDVKEPFNEPDSWEISGWEDAHYDFAFPVFDGRYIYFSPLYYFDNSQNIHVPLSAIGRYDTTDPNVSFADVTDWEWFDAKRKNENLKGFRGTAYDNQYVYFVTWRQWYPYNSLILRYNTNLDSDFNEPDSWEVYESNDTYVAIIYDDERYLYFTPRNDDYATGQFLRFDTTKDFNNDPNAWKYFDPGENGVGENLKNYHGGVSDGHYCYFTPWRIGGNVHGEILRYDFEYGYGTCWDPDECAGQPFGDATCDGDVNVGAINLGDLVALKRAWGKSAPYTSPFCCADFNHDGAVNLGDLLILKKNWGRKGFTPSTGNQICPD